MDTRQSASAVITGTGYYLPGERILSRDIEARMAAGNPELALPEGVIERLSGVVSRHHAPEHWCSSDLAAQAGMNALHNANLDPLDIDLVIFAAATQDVAEPATAAIVQEKMGCFNAHTFDVKNACNSFLNALDMASALIQTARVQRVLIVSGEVVSPFIDWNIHDHQELVLKFVGLTLGDGGGACVVEAASDARRGILPGRFYSDGRQWRVCTVLSGGTLMKGDLSKMYLESRSRELFSLAARHIPPLLAEVLDAIGWDLHGDVKYIVPHQVSLRFLHYLSDVLQFPLSKCAITLDGAGNTAAASIPLALARAVEEGKIHPRDKILLIGGAAGFSAAIIPIVW